MNQTALAVTKHLNLNMAWSLHVFFYQHRFVTKAAPCFALTRSQRIGEISSLVHDAHAFATATGAGFDQHWKANALRFLRQHGGVLVGTVVAGHQGHTGFFHQLFGGRLQPHRLN